jgi:hypothetical protein
MLSKYPELATQENFEEACKKDWKSTAKIIVEKNGYLNTPKNFQLANKTFKAEATEEIFNSFLKDLWVRDNYALPPNFDVQNKIKVSKLLDEYIEDEQSVLRMMSMLQVLIIVSNFD